MPFRMHPPRHGYEGIKTDYASGGALGNRRRRDKQADKENVVIVWF